MARTYVSDGAQVFRVVVITEYAADPNDNHRPDAFTTTRTFGPYGTIGVARRIATNNNIGPSRYGRPFTKTITVQQGTITWKVTQ